MASQAATANIDHTQVQSLIPNLHKNGTFKFVSIECNCDQ
jgi:hypothetical protein